MCAVLQRLIRVRLSETPVNQVAPRPPGALTVGTTTHSDPPANAERPPKPQWNLYPRCRINGHPRRRDGQKTDLRRSIRQSVVERSQFKQPIGIK
jgi:hypothetical protein